MSAAHQVYSGSLVAADDAHKERMKTALATRTTAVSLARSLHGASDSGIEPIFNSMFVAADFAHFEALRSSEVRRVQDRQIARAAFREMTEPR